MGVNRGYRWRPFWRRAVAETLAWVMVLGGCLPPLQPFAFAATIPVRARPSRLPIAVPPPGAPESPSAVERIGTSPGAPSFAGQPGGGIEAQFPFFQSQRYVRTTGPTNVYTDTVTVPAWLVGPFTMSVQNGEPGGEQRISSATIQLNDETVAVQSDFNTQVPGFERTVTLLPGSNTLRVSLDSTPYGYITIRFLGMSADHTAPVLEIGAPPDGSALNEPSPALTVDYQDLVGAGEPAASGVNLATLRATLDGIDRSSLFSAGEGQATATLTGTVELAEGPHVLAVSIADTAGNAAEATSTFIVDRTPPDVTIATPPGGAYLRGPVIAVTGEVHDATPATVEVNGVAATVSGAAFNVEIPAVEGPMTIRAVARDAAGNQGEASTSITIDTAPPAIVVSEPSDGAVTRAGSITVAGTVADASPATLRVNGDQVPLAAGAFSTSVPLPQDGETTITLVADDAAGNETTVPLHVTRDQAPPEITIVAPEPGAVLGDQPIAVTADVTDLTPVTVQINGAPATQVQNSWTGAVTFTGDGAHTITVTAVDAAGNDASAGRDITLDLTAPIVVIENPAPNALTSAESIAVSGHVTDVTVTSVVVGGVTTPIQPQPGLSSVPFTATVPLVDGDNHIEAMATDAFARTGSAEVMVTRDSIAPSVQITAPDTISRRRGAQAAISASDNLAIDRVVVTVADGAPVTFSSASFTVDLTVPESIAVGGELVVTATAVDTAGNSAPATRSLRVIADGVLVGQVLDDETGLPIEGATVQSGERSTTTDARGQYSLPAVDINVVVSILKDGWTSVERVVPVQSGVGTAVVDARLTRLGPPTIVGPAGEALSGSAGRVTGFNPTVSVTIPAGGVAADTEVRLTPLSPQGLPALLPLGWSPLAAFDLRAPAGIAGASASAPLHAETPHAQSQALPTSPVHLVEYRPQLHAWVMRVPNVPVADGAATAALPPLAALVPGTEGDVTTAFALVVADQSDPPLTVPDVGVVLDGVALVELPATATSVGAVTPPVLPAEGGLAMGVLAIQSPAPLPSGTVVQAQVTESFSLASGESASEETRAQDLILYATPVPSPSVVAVEDPALTAYFPMAPAGVFRPSELIEGRVHFDILAGRERVRGQTGGSEPATLTAGDARLVVPAHALPEDTAVRLQTTVLSSFLPAATDLQPLAEALVDLSGRTLGLAAELSLATAALGAIGESDRVLLGRVERVEGIPRVEIVGIAEIAGDRLVSRPAPGLPGVTVGGRYVLYRITSPLGFVAATVTAAGAPVPSVVTSDRWPFVAHANSQGAATLVAPTGSTRINARVLGTALGGSAAIDVVADQVTPVSLSLAGTVTTATVTPADRTTAVPPTIQIEIATTAPIAASSLATAQIQLLKGETPVEVNLVLAASGRTLAVVPAARLEAGALYLLTATGLQDLYGGAIAVARTVFTTATDAALAFDPSALRVSFPDENGRVQVTAPAGSLQPGTNVLIVNSGSGEVISFTALNDGSLSGELDAAISHRLLITITDPQGKSLSFERSQYVAPDGTTGIGAGGGTVDGDGGIQLRVPAGAVDRSVVLKIEPFGPEFLPDAPVLPDGHFGGGMKIGAAQAAHFNKEIDLVFPVPEGVPADPREAFYYVYRRIEGPDGQVFYETIDTAAVEGTGADARIVTASYPFTGYGKMWNRWDPTGGASFGLNSFGAIGTMATCHALVMWTVNALLPGLPTQGVITGRVLRPRFEAGSTTPVYDGVPDVLVRRTEAGSEEAATIAFTQADGRFTIFDPYFTSGTVEIRAETPQGPFSATAFAVAGLDTKIETDDGLAALLGQGVFQNVAYANITLPLVQPPPPTPQVDIRVFTETENVRTDIKGLAVAGTPLVIGFTAKDGTVIGASISGQSYGVRDDPRRGQPTGMDVILDQPFTPAQPGSYTVATTALAPFGPPVPASLTFRVIAEGGGTTTPVAGRPGVVRVSPANRATGVAVSVYPQVAFSEPVTGIISSGADATVRLTGPDGDVPLQVSAITVVDGQSVPVENVEPGHAVTSLTLMPMVGLRYGATYTLSLSEAIVDRDVDANGVPTPQPLVPFASTFTTFGPEALGGSDDAPQAVGLVVLGDRAYLAETDYTGGTGATLQSGYLDTYDLTNPALPEPIPPPVRIGYPPRDIAGEMTGDADARQRTVVVATAPRTWFMLQGELIYSYEIKSTPSNLFVYDVSTEPAKWVGAVSLTANVNDGVPNRIVLKDGFAYAATQGKGIQVVDLARAREGFSPDGVVDYTTYAKVANGNLNTSAIVLTVPVTDPPDAAPGEPAVHLPLTDLKVMDLAVGGSPRRVVLATGPRRQIGLVVADTLYGQTLWRGALVHPTGAVDVPSAIAVATLDDTPYALVGGVGTVNGVSTPVLAVVSLSPLVESASAPVVVALLALPHAVGDILITGQTAIVSGDRGSVDANGQPGVATLVDLTLPVQPRIVGSLSGVGSRLALTADNILLSTERGFVKGEGTPLGGLRTAALEQLVYFRKVDPEPFLVDKNASLNPLVVEVGTVPPDYEISTSELEISREGQVIAALPIVSRKVTIPAGSAFNPDLHHAMQAVINRGALEKELISSKKALRPTQVEFSDTTEVEVQENGRLRSQDVARFFDARPAVTLTYPSLERGAAETAFVTISGSVRDALAPIMSVLVGQEKVDVTQTSSGPDGLGPFEGTFTKRVITGRHDQFIAVTAVNALANIGWDGMWIRRNPDLSGQPGWPPSVEELESLPPFVDGQAYRFRLEVKDLGLMTAAGVGVRVNTGIDEKLLTLPRVGNVFRSEPLYLVPKTFVLPEGLDPTLKRKLEQTRLKGELGTKPSFTYVREDLKDELILSGVVLVDPDNHPQPLVPGALARPQVWITDFNVNGSTRDVQVRGTIYDPLASAVPSLPSPQVTINGVAATVSATGGSNFTFVSNQAVPLPFPLTHVQARAQNVTGAFGVAGRIVTLEDENGPLAVPEVESEETQAILPASVKPFRVKVYGPKLGVETITGAVRGVHSRAAVASQPQLTLQFEERPSEGGVSVYLSKATLVAARIPGHSWREPTTPSELAGTPVLPVEVAGFVQANVDMGAAGSLAGLTDVSGLEMLAPRDNSIVNVSGDIAPDQTVSFAQSWKWRGISAPPSVQVLQPGLLGPADGPYAAVLSSLTTGLDRRAVSVSGRLPGGFEENAFFVTASDDAGNTFESEATVFAFTNDMVRNESHIGADYQDPAALQLRPNVYFLPAVADGMELVYPVQGDVAISEHLNKTGLRPIAVKRNGGTLVTAIRMDGRTESEALAEDIPGGLPLPEGRVEPLADQLVDGEDLYYRDILDLGWRTEWLATYTDVPGYPYIGVWRRSELIKKARLKLGLPASENGRSQEYQEHHDAAIRAFALDMFSIALPFALRGLGALIGVARGAFISWTPRTLLEVTEIVPGVVTMTPVAVEEANVLRPVLQPLASHTLDMSAARLAELPLEYRRLQVAARNSWVDKAARDVIAQQMGEISTQLGVYAAQQVALQYIPNMQGATRICCDGAVSGGGATGKLDEVWLRADGSVVVIEAKGANRWRNVMSQLGGRKVQIGQETFYAMQGRREYLQEIARLMSASSNPLDVQRAGTEVLGALQRNEIEYYITSAKFAGKRMRRTVQRGLVWGVSKFVRVWRAVL